ncbi:MAG: ADP-ribosylglycohydrolase family protein [Clostridia bacterium]|nr:ADP-ribosylglycohydrolase family protein [Clostridia bacterium]
MKKDYIKAVMIGHAVGDAIGVPVEFYLRKNIEKNPVADMRGYGTYDVPAGTWSDDTSMSLAALDSLSGGEVDYFDIMVNFAKWLNNGDYTPAGKSFDVGRTCLRAILNFAGVAYLEEHGFILPPGFDIFECGLRDEYSNGNGSLMRIHPFVLYAHAKGLPFVEWIDIIKKASMLTHAHSRSQIGCIIYTSVLMELLKEQSRAAIVRGLERAKAALSDHPESVHYERIFKENFSLLARDEIKSSGYVVDTLEAAIWCLLTTDSYRDCVLKAVNLGGDTDTVAAVAGGLAGALYGYDAIPEEWRNTLIKREYIEKMCETCAENWG